MKTIIAYNHTHWDREWYREFEEFRLRLIEVFDEIIKKLQTEELPVFYFDGQTAAIEDYLEIFPEKLTTIQKLIHEKKLYIGPFYCSADEFLTTGESLLRNLYFGIKKSKELGCNNFIGYLSDTFGHCSSMPEILKAANIDKAILWRGLGKLSADLNWDCIKTTYLIQGYFNDFLNSDLNYEKKAELLEKYIDKISEKSREYILLPIGADHLKACDNLKDIINKLNKTYSGKYKILLSTPFEYFANIKDENRHNISGEFLDNSLNFILQGIYSTRNDIKQANSVCERKINKAETFNAINSTFFKKENRQKQIDYAYKTLIKNHAHDSIYGCSTDKTCQDVLNRYERVETLTDGIIKRCERDLKSEKGISAINLSNTDFSGIAEIWTTKNLPSNLKAVISDKKQGFSDEILYDTNRIPITEDWGEIYKYSVKLKNIPAFSSKNITKNDISEAKDIKTGKNFIENEFLSIQYKNGKIDITDKKSHKIFHDFIKITDVADIGDSYNFAPIKNDKKIIAKIKSFKTQDKKLFAKAETEFEIKIPEQSKEKRRSMIAPKHVIKMVITLKSGTNYAEFELFYTNKSENHKLQISFNLPEKIYETASEDLFKTVKRTFDPDYDINELVPAPRGKELKTNTMPFNRFIWLQNTGIITDGLHEAEIDKNTASITLLRATGIISNPKNPTRGTPAGPPILTPEMQMKGEQKAFFALAFTNNCENLYKICDKLFNPPILIQGNIENKQFISKDNENIKITAIKKSAKNELILRVVNYSDNKEASTISCGKYKLYETDICEEKNLPTNSVLYFNPHEIKTVKMK